MQFLHRDFHLQQGDIVEVHCDYPCNILLLNDAHFQLYKMGQHFHHQGGGGVSDTLPTRLIVPETGHWTVIIDRGGDSVDMNHSITLYPV